MSTPEIILKLSNIESYYGPIMAIRGISLEVARGQIVTLLGANGAGKTTGSRPFRAFSIRKRADRILRENRSSAWKPTRSGLGLTMCGGAEVFPFLSVRENLMMGAYPRSDRDGVAQDLERVYAISRG